MRKFFPLFAIAALLPFVIGAATQSGRQLFSSFAGGPDPLRLWFNPANITSNVNLPFPVQIFAAYDSGRPLPAGLSVTLAPQPDVSVSRSVFSAPAFSGQILLGTFTLTPTRPGQFTLGLDRSQILVALPASAIHTSPLTVTVIP